MNIGRWPCAYLDHGEACTTRANICTSMAGWLAEEKFYGVPDCIDRDDRFLGEVAAVPSEETSRRANL